MKIEYFPETDTLSLVFAAGPFEAEGGDTNDKDITLLYDRQGRIAEIVIERASRRVDLAETRRQIGFEEIVGTSAVEAEVPK